MSTLQLLIKRFWILTTILLAALFTGLGWLLSSSGGLSWAIEVAERASAGQLRIEGAQGRLLGPISAQSLSIGAGKDRYTARDLRLVWRPVALLSGRLEIVTLSAARVELRVMPGTTPATLPESLTLPLAARLDTLEIGVLELRESPTDEARTLAWDIRAAISSDGRRHRLDKLHLNLDAGNLAAKGTLAAEAPFALQAEAELTTSGIPAMLVAVKAGGTLAATDIDFNGRGEGFSADGQARLRPFAIQPLAALRLAAQGLDPRAFLPDAPQAQLTMNADLTESPAGALVGSLNFKNAKPAPFNQGRLPFLQLDTRMALHLGNETSTLRLDGLALTVDASGGSVSGSADLAWAANTALPQGKADLRVARLNPAALHSALRAVRLAGHIRLDGDATTQNATLALGDGPMRLDAQLVRHGDSLEFVRLLLAHGNAKLSGRGKLRLDDPRAWRFAGQLHHFDLSAFAHAPKSDLNAGIESSGRLVPQLDGKLSFSFHNSRFAGQPLVGGGDLEFAGLNDITALIAANGKAHMRGEINLRLGDSRLHAQGGWGGSGEHLQLELKAPRLAQLDMGLSGMLDLSASLAGWPTRPDLVFSARAQGLAFPEDHTLGHFEAKGRLQGGVLELALSADNYHRQKETHFEHLQIAAVGTQGQHNIHAEARLNTARSVILEASGALRLTPENWRDTNWRGAIKTLAISGGLPLRLLAPASTEIGRKRVLLGAAELAFADGRITLAETIWTPQRWSSSGRFTGIALRPGEMGNEAVKNPLRIGGEWSLADTGLLNGWLHAARESGDWVLPGDFQRPLGLNELRLEARSEKGRLRASIAAKGACIGSWQANASMALSRTISDWFIAPQAPLEGQINVSVPELACIGPVISGNLTSAGSLEIDAGLAGTPDAPEMRGHIRGSGLAIGLIDQNINLREGALDIRLDQETLYVERLEFTAPHDIPAVAVRTVGLYAKELSRKPGRLSIGGKLDLKRRTASLAATLSRLPLSRHTERWVVASGSGKLDYSEDRLHLGTELVADAGYIAQAASGRPQPADDVVILGREKPTQRGPRIESDISLDLGEHFHLRAAGLSARLSGRLRVRGNGESPFFATGGITTKEAMFEAYGQHLTVERGIVNFQGPFDDPGLSVLALRKGLAVEAGVAITGTAQRPVVRLVSTPSVPDSEKLSWIVLGRAPDSGGTDASLLLSAASTILGGRGEGPLRQITEAIGIDEFSLRQEQGDDPLASQVMTLGKRLSARAFLNYEQGLAAAAGAVKLTYILTPQISVVTRTGEDNAVEVFYNFTLD